MYKDKIIYMTIKYNTYNGERAEIELDNSEPYKKSNFGWRIVRFGLRLMFGKKWKVRRVIPNDDDGATDDVVNTL